MTTTMIWLCRWWHKECVCLSPIASSSRRALFICIYSEITKMYLLSIILRLIIIIDALTIVSTRHRPFWYDRSCPSASDGCLCLIRTKSKCCCVGQSITSISRNFTANLKILYRLQYLSFSHCTLYRLLGNVAIESISVDDLANYPQLEQM